MTGSVSPVRWYDALNPWDASDDFYLDLVLQAGSVTDVGCGTGKLLHRARDAGHPGHWGLVTMTGHAFQTLVTEDELTRSLGAIRGALESGGRFAFETRNPGAEAWTHWNVEQTVSDVDVERVTLSRRVTEVANGTVTFEERFTAAAMDATVSTTLRFLDSAELASVLTFSGFVVESQFGNWDRSPLGGDSPEIITIATPVT